MAKPSFQGWIFPSEAADILGVSVKTVIRWNAEGKFQRRGVRVMTTLGGHRRFFEADVVALARTLTNDEAVRS